VISPHEIRYESIKEARDWYYVEYSPPFSEFLFSSLYLTIEQDAATRRSRRSRATGSTTKRRR
jgi:hypothetical protein